MKYISILFLLITNAVFSQSNVLVGKPYPVIDSPTKLYFARGREVMTVKVEKGGILTIQKFNTERMELTGIKSYDDFPKSSILEKILCIGKRYFVFFTRYNNEIEELYVREIEFASGKFTGPGVKILSVKQKVTGALGQSGFMSFAVTDKFSFYHNSDSSKTLITYRIRPEIKSDKKNFDIIGLSVFDDEMDQLWSHEITMPYTEKKMDIMDYGVDKNNNAYLVTRVFDDNSTNEKNNEGNPNYTIEIFKVDAAGVLKKNPISIPEKFIQTLWIYENPKGFMVCAGFYNKGHKNLGIDGILLSSLDNNGKQLKLKLYEIPLGIINQYESAKSQKKATKKDEDGAAEFSNLKLREVLFNNDGSMILIGEQMFSVTRNTYSSTTGGSSYTVYYYNDILVTRLDPAGEMTWMKKLPKQQKGGVPGGGLSYKYLRAGKTHSFLFLDNEKNRQLSVNSVPEVHVDGQGGFLTSYNIDDQTGAVTKRHIFDVRDVKGMEVYQFQPNRIVGLRPNEAVVEVYKKKKEDVLLKIAY